MISAHKDYFFLRYVTSHRRRGFPLTGVGVFLQRESIGSTATVLPYAKTNDRSRTVSGQRRPWTFDLVRRLGDIVSLDVRSLALLRVSLGLLILVDLSLRVPDLRAHYTDFGVLPRDVAISRFVNEWCLSINFISGTLLAQGVLLGLAAICGFALLIGYWTTLATLLSWLFLISLHSRNPMIVDSGDILLHLLIFWSLFLPLGASYSLDNILKPGVLRPARVVSMGSAALILQICFVYWFTAVLKTDQSWHREGSAVYYALSLDSFATRIGLWLRQFPSVTTALTFSTLTLEAFGPYLLFTPVANGPIRCLTIVLFLGLHAGIGLCLDLGIFPFIMLTTWLCLLPSWFWEKSSIPQDFSPDQKKRMRKWLRRWFGLRPQIRWIGEESPPRWRTVLSTMFCAACLIYVFLWNLRTTDFDKYSHYLPPDYNWIGYVIRIDQMWNMFAPKPLLDDGWYVIPARLKNGKEIDLMSGQSPVQWEKPSLVAPLYRNQRWRKYLLNLWERENSGHRLYFGRYLCRNWNASHKGDETLQTFGIYFMKETTLPNGKVAPIEKVILWNHSCFG